MAKHQCCVVGLALDDSRSVLLARCAAICNSLYAMQTCYMKPLRPLVQTSTFMVHVLHLRFLQVHQIVPMCIIMQATPAECITGTPSFMALSVLKGKPQTVSSELESLYYSMLYAATSGALHWGQYSREESAAYDAKMASMLNAAECQAKVVARIHSAELVPIATRLRALFFEDGLYISNVTPELFISAFVN